MAPTPAVEFAKPKPKPRAAALPAAAAAVASSASAGPAPTPVAAAAAPVPTPSTPVPRVFVTTGISASRMVALTASVATLGGATLTSEITDATTHIVTSVAGPDAAARLTKRTFKYMHGIMLRLWVVSEEWVSASAAAGRWLPETPFLIQGEMTLGATGAAARARQMVRHARVCHDLWGSRVARFV